MTPAARVDSLSTDLRPADILLRIAAPCDWRGKPYMTEQMGLRRLLVLQGSALESTGIVESLRAHFEIRMAQQLDEALAAMREQPFDAVLAETSDFLPLERGIVTQQASVVLDRIGDGVCIVGARGELVWTNRRMRSFPPDVVEPLRRRCEETYEQFATDPNRGGEQGKRFSLMPAGRKYFEVICSPVRDAEGLLRQVVAVVVDATSQRRQQLKLNAIDRAGRELVRLEEDAESRRDAVERLRLLEERILHYSREALDYQNFAVLTLDRRTNRLEVLVSQGLHERQEARELFASPDDNGICGYVAATGRSYICPDVSSDPRYLPGLPHARSSLTVPLRLHDKVIGVLNVESDRVGAFREEDRQFAEIFANYVALALHILNLLASERSTAHTQAGDSIYAELAGPLGDIITEATELKEDYIGLDDLRARLDALIDRAGSARRTVRQLADSRGAAPDGAMAGPVEEDPVLIGKRVLVADDEAIIRQTIRSVLTARGCLVDAVEDGAEARRLLADRRYDLVISDIKMPGATGYEVFAAAKAACAETAVILITAFGYDPNHSAVRAAPKGLAAVLLKPFKVDGLLVECRAALQADGG